MPLKVQLCYRRQDFLRHNTQENGNEQEPEERAVHGGAVCTRRRLAQLWVLPES